LVASIFATMISDFLESEIALRRGVSQVTLFSDGCTYQNRNAIVSNAILEVAVRKKVTIYQKFLEKGHTQMECDSMHSSIERRDVQVTADYVQIIRNERLFLQPYSVVYLDHAFFKDFSRNLVYPSIRPGNKVGDPTVIDIRDLKYSMDNMNSFKTDCDDSYTLLLRSRRAARPIASSATSQSAAPVMYKECLPIKSEKFVHLQQLKKVILPDYHYFYDSLKHICEGQCTYLIATFDSTVVTRSYCCCTIITEQLV